MKYLRFFFLTVLLLLFMVFMSGCARQHSVRPNGNSLTFSYADADAGEVIFVSSVDNFTYHPASKGKRNRWQVTIPLAREFTYFYIVDGVVTLPDCPATVADDFGTQNCLYEYGM